MSRTVIINGREYPVENVRVKIVSRGQVIQRIGGPPHGSASGAFTSTDPHVVDALRAVAVEPPRPDGGAAVRAGIDAARALGPKPRNRHERRALAAKRRREGL